MNYEADDLLDMVDEWKFKLHKKLSAMTPQQREEFWRKSQERARARGLNVVDKLPGKSAAAKPVKPKRRQSKSKS